MCSARKFPELTRSDPHLFLEQTTHVFWMFEAGFVGHFRERQIGLRQEAAHSFEPDAQNFHLG
jgi:hypothetical protein